MYRATSCLLATLLVCGVCGCKAKIFRAETELRPDGSVRRALYQPADETPQAARDSSPWQGSTYAARIPHEDWNGSIAELPSAQPDKDHDYFAAWGDFSAVDEMPQATVFDAPAGIADGTLERAYERTDYVLVVEHRWRETLTDVVSLDDMHRARQELAEIVLPLAEKFLERAYGEDHDVQPLVDWMHQQARPMVYELTDAYFDLATRDGPPDEATLTATFEPILKRHAVSIRDASGAMLELDEVVSGHLRQLLVDKLRRRDGSPAAEETIRELLIFLGGESSPDAEPQRLNRIASEIVAERFTTQDAMNAELRPLAIRILGLYGADFGPERQFQYKHQMPGILVETSGELLSDNETLWRFSDNQAYPSGYTMFCRSLEPNVGLEQKLLNKPVLTDRKEMLRYLELVRDNEPLLAVMRMCEADGDLRRLRREYEALAEAGDDSAAAFGELLALLEGR